MNRFITTIPRIPHLSPTLLSRHTRTMINLTRQRTRLTHGFTLQRLKTLLRRTRSNRSSTIIRRSYLKQITRTEHNPNALPPYNRNSPRTGRRVFTCPGTTWGKLTLSIRNRVHTERSHLTNLSRGVSRRTRTLKSLRNTRSNLSTARHAIHSTRTLTKSRI